MLKHYYHIFAGTPDLTSNWKPAISEHLEALHSTDLYDALDEFNVGIVGHPVNRDIIKQYLIDNQIEFNVVAEQDRGWEQATLTPLHQDAQSSSEHFKVLYAHTKGVANQSTINIHWRKGMTKEVTDKWRAAMCLLESHDAVGPHWVRKHRFFAGNFWWANSSFIAALNPPTLNSRWDAESWLRISETPFRVFDLCPGMTYVERVPSRTHETFFDTSMITFRCDGAVLHYKPRRTYREPINDIIRPILERGKDLVLLDPLSLEDLDSRIKSFSDEGDMNE